MSGIEEIKDKVKRERSSEYPGYSFNECIEFIKIIDGLGNGLIAYSIISNQLGLSSITTKSFTNKISSSRQFGLITVANKTAQLTDEAKKILYPTGSEDIDIKIECVKRPTLYGRLIERFTNKPLPTKEILSNILFNDYGILKSVKDVVAEKFIESMTQLNLVVNGVLNVNNCAEKDFTEVKENNLIPEEKETQEVNVNTKEYQELNLSVDSGKMAKIIIPIDCSEDELLMIKDMIDLLFKRKFGI